MSCEGAAHEPIAARHAFDRDERPIELAAAWPLLDRALREWAPERMFGMGAFAAVALLVSVGCGESEPGGSSGTGAGQGSGATSSSGSAGESGGANSGAATSGGSTSGGSSAESGSGGRPSGSDGGAGAQSTGGRDPGEGGADSGPPDGLYDCDARKVTCRRAPPECDTFDVPSVEGTCYGECVDIELCACSSADECPNNNEFTCWMQTHCGPYVQ